MPISTKPIYVFTYFLQRCKFPDMTPGEDQGTPRVESGYRIIPGRKVEVWLYNTTNARYEPARDYRVSEDGLANRIAGVLEFWQPIEFMSYKAFSFFVDHGGDWAGTDATDPIMGELVNPNDVVKIKFINDSKMPSDEDGNPYPCGVFASTDQDADMFDLPSVAGV